MQVLFCPEMPHLWFKVLQYTLKWQGRVKTLPYGVWQQTSICLRYEKIRPECSGRI